MMNGRNEAKIKQNNISLHGAFVHQYTGTDAQYMQCIKEAGVQ